MAAQTIDDFLAGPVMTEAVANMQIKRGLPRLAIPGLYTPSDNKSCLDQVKYRQFSGNRSLPPAIAHQSPSASVEVPGDSWVYGTAIGTKINLPVTYDWITKINSGIPYFTDGAKREMTKRFEDFAVFTDNFRTTAVNMMILTGNIYTAVDTTNTMTGQQLVLAAGTGNGSQTIACGGVGPSTFSTGSSWTNTSTIVGDWAIATTDIELSLRILRQGYLKTSNWMPDTIIYGANIPSYLANNTSLQTYMSRAALDFGKNFLQTNEVPARLLDYNWVPGYNAYFNSGSSPTNNGTPNTILGADQIVIIPAVDSGWYELIEIGTMVPNAMAMMTGSLEAMLGQASPVYGKFAYAAMMGLDPFSIKTIMGDYFLPISKSALTQWIATVH